MSEYWHDAKERGRSFEKYVLSVYGGRPHVAFKNGIECSSAGKDVSVVDILRETEDGQEAIECKSFNLNIPWYTSSVYYRIRYQIERYHENLPKGTAITLVFEDLDFSDDDKKDFIDDIMRILGSTYHNINTTFLKRSTNENHSS